MVRVLEVDQFTSTGNIREMSMKDFEQPNAIDAVHGGDSEAAKRIFGGQALVKEVAETSQPIKGYVWFIDGPDGKLKLFKANYDSGD